jgi:ubiquinone/menaquinone biosynthesis C-methylase UbiE
MLRKHQNIFSVLEVASCPGYAMEAGVIVVEFQHGNVADIDFPGNSFDFIICTAAFKNFKQPFKPLTQMCKVLKSGGNVLIMNTAVSNQQIEDYIESIKAKGMDKLYETDFQVFS